MPIPPSSTAGQSIHAGWRVSYQASFGAALGGPPREAAAALIFSARRVRWFMSPRPTPTAVITPIQGDHPARPGPWPDATCRTVNATIPTVAIAAPMIVVRCCHLASPASRAARSGSG